MYEGTGLYIDRLSSISLHSGYAVLLPSVATPKLPCSTFGATSHNRGTLHALNAVRK
jgi:hypothetical protein